MLIKIIGSSDCQILSVLVDILYPSAFGLVSATPELPFEAPTAFHRLAGARDPSHLVVLPVSRVALAVKEMLAEIVVGKVNDACQ